MCFNFLPDVLSFFVFQGLLTSDFTFLKVPSFPLFLRQGRMQANIFLVKSRLLVDAQMLELLKAFHHYLFDSVLRLVKGGLVFVPDKAPVNVLIVPLRRGTFFHCR